MRLFSEKVTPTFTSSNQNILTIKDFNEIFFDVYELEINGNKYIAEKVSEYKGNPVVNIPIVIEGKELEAPFVLQRGKLEVIFNESNSTFLGPATSRPEEVFVESKSQEEEVEEIIFEKKESILKEIQQARKLAGEYAVSIKKQNLQEAAKAKHKERETFFKSKEKFKADLIEEFLQLSNVTRDELFEYTEQENEKAYNFIVESITSLSDKLSQDLESTLQEQNAQAVELFESRVSELAQNILTDKLLTEITSNNNSNNKAIDAKFETVAKTLTKVLHDYEQSLSEKVESTLASYDKTIVTLEQSNIELNDNIAKNSNKALSRIGNVKTQLEGAIINASFDLTGDTKSSSNAWVVYLWDGSKYNGSGSSYGSGSSATTDVFQCALDLDNGKIWWGKNGTFFASGDPAAGTNAAFTNLSGQSVAPTAGVYGSSSSNGAIINFGQRPFAYTPPTGFLQLNTFNLPTPAIGATPATTANKYFNISLYTGTGATQTIANSSSMQPDFIWFKSRALTYSHALFDSVRGVTKGLDSDTTATELTSSAGNDLSAFTSTGFTVGPIQNWNSPNNSSSNPVAWQWRASNTTAVTNTAGSIISTVSSNTTVGFSIVTYTGNATAGATVGHGCQVGGNATAPSMVILKGRSISTNWYVYHSGLTSTAYQIYLNLPLGEDNAVTTAFNNAAPGATTFTLPGTGFGSNNSGETYVAYCFAAVPGYSAFGSYTGNGSTDGTFVYLGFRPRFIILKHRGAGSDAWILMDTSIQTYNVVGNFLQPSQSDQELYAVICDFLSNGFKLRETYTTINTGSNTYIYMAFAENPFKYANAR